MIRVRVFSFISDGISRSNAGNTIIKNVLFSTVAFFCNGALRTFSCWPVIIGMAFPFTLYVHVTKISRYLCCRHFSDFFRITFLFDGLET
jgi:hypothetical protein